MTFLAALKSCLGSRPISDGPSSPAGPFSELALRESWNTLSPGVKGRMNWLGHASVATQYPVSGRSEPITFGYDVHLSKKCSPIGGGNRRIDLPFTAEQAARSELFDVFVFSHDHYDHCDADTMRAFSKSSIDALDVAAADEASQSNSITAHKYKRPHAVVPEGMKKLFLSWGWEENRVHEMSQGQRLSVAVDPRTGALSFSDRPESRWQDWWRDGVDDRDGKEKGMHKDEPIIDEQESDPDGVPRLPYRSPTSPMFTDTDLTGSGPLIVDVDDDEASDDRSVEYERFDEETSVKPSDKNPSKTPSTRPSVFDIYGEEAHHKGGRMGEDLLFWFRPTECLSYVTTHRPGSEMTGEMRQDTAMWFGGDSGMGEDGFKEMAKRRGKVHMAAIPIASGAASDKFKKQINSLSELGEKTGISAFDWRSKIRELHMQEKDPHHVAANILHRASELGPVDLDVSRQVPQHRYTLRGVLDVVNAFKRTLEKPTETGTSHPFAIGMHQGTFCTEETAEQTRADFEKASQKYPQMFGMPPPNCWKEYRTLSSMVNGTGNDANQLM